MQKNALQRRSFLEFRGTAFQKRKNINKNPHKKSIAPWFPIAPPMQNHENRFQTVGMVATMQIMHHPPFLRGKCNRGE